MALAVAAGLVVRRRHADRRGRLGVGRRRRRVALALAHRGVHPRQPPAHRDEPLGAGPDRRAVGEGARPRAHRGDLRRDRRHRQRPVDPARGCARADRPSRSARRAPSWGSSGWRRRSPGGPASAAPPRRWRSTSSSSSASGCRSRRRGIEPGRQRGAHRRPRRRRGDRARAARRCRAPRRAGSTRRRSSPRSRWRRSPLRPFVRRRLTCRRGRPPEVHYIGACRSRASIPPPASDLRTFEPESAAAVEAKLARAAAAFRRLEPAPGRRARGRRGARGRDPGGRAADLRPADDAGDGEARRRGRRRGGEVRDRLPLLRRARRGVPAARDRRRIGRRRATRSASSRSARCWR